MKPENDSQENLEQAARKRRQQKYVFYLYISGATPRSNRAIENIRRLAEENLKDRYELKVIDIYQHPEMARSEQIIAAPTLVKKLPEPLRRYIGDLSDAERLMVSLEIDEDNCDYPDTIA